MNLENIRYINVNDIYPHPYNPRKDLGDLSELAESIKQNGIMQNLTVIPYIGHGGQNPETPVDWTVVIGHRRLEAAKIAGLEVVPCVVSEMDEKTQIGTMLLENIQRNSLTVYEQAKGMQMMMDLGDSVAEISQKTGFSETTVRHRIKIGELDEEQVKKSMGKQPSIQDFIKLEEIKDVDLRNEALKSIGTSNFEWNFKNILQKDKWKKKKAEIIEELRTYATELENDFDRNNFKYVKYINQHNGTWEKPDDTDEKEYYFQIGEYGGIDIYTVKETVEDAADVPYEESEEEKQRKILRDRAAELTERAYDFRKEFVLNHKYSDKDLRVITELYIKSAFKYDIESITPIEWINYLGLDIKTGECDYDELVDNVTDEIKEDMQTNPLKYLTTILLINSDGKSQGYYYYYPKFTHEDNIWLDEIYAFLTSLGYEMSEEEKQLQDGTHEIFQQSEVEEDEE